MMLWQAYPKHLKMSPLVQILRDKMSLSVQMKYQRLKMKVSALWRWNKTRGVLKRMVSRAAMSSLKLRPNLSSLVRLRLMLKLLSAFLSAPNGTCLLKLETLRWRSQRRKSRCASKTIPRSCRSWQRTWICLTALSRLSKSWALRKHQSSSSIDPVMPVTTQVQATMSVIVATGKKKMFFMPSATIKRRSNWTWWAMTNLRRKNSWIISPYICLSITVHMIRPPES